LVVWESDLLSRPDSSERATINGRKPWRCLWNLTEGRNKMTPKELGMKPREISRLPKKSVSKELDPKQGDLGLWVEKQAEPDGIGMGVLRDGTAFLTGRGLARLVGLENLHIRTISLEWNDDPPKPRIERIKEILSKRGIT